MKDLIEKLEAASEGSRALDGDIAEALPDATGLAEAQRRNANTLKRHHCGQPHQWGRSTPTWERWTADCYTTSLDAALTLVPEGMEWELSNIHGAARCTMGLNVNGPDGPWYGEHIDGDCTALALCIAAIKAREAQQ